MKQPYHNPTATLKEGGVWFGYYPYAEPKQSDYDPGMLPRFQKDYSEWLSSKVSVKFKEQGHEQIKIAKRMYKPDYLEKGVPINPDWLSRIQVVDGEAVILPEPLIKSVTNCPTCGAECDVNDSHEYVAKGGLSGESQEETLDALLEIEAKHKRNHDPVDYWSDTLKAMKKEILQHFEIKRR